MTPPTWQILINDAEALLADYRQTGLTIATAESCTGGLIAAALTEIAGSSDVFLAGFVTYSNDAKRDILGIDANVIEIEGAVSEPVARAMAEGALARSAADVTVAVTGIAGPTGASPAKPVGLVHLAASRHGRPTEHWERRYGDEITAPLNRSAIRLATTRDALVLLSRVL